MIPQIHYKMTEEIVRWCFELKICSSKDWWISFTNPTAGPWKRLMGRNKTDQEGEVYRFPRNDERPDVVAVNDKRRIVLIVEAKDSAAKLVMSEQARKSSEVVTSLCRALSALHSNEFWGVRTDYNFIAGLLWGRSVCDEPINPTSLFDLYKKHLPKVPLVGFETLQSSNGFLCVEELADKRSPSFASLLV
jgi:hypothetical protein